MCLENPNIHALALVDLDCCSRMHPNYSLDNIESTCEQDFITNSWYEAILLNSDLGLRLCGSEGYFGDLFHMEVSLINS